MAGIARMRSVVLDCPEPLRLAEFYRDLVGWEITEVEDDWVNLRGGPGVKLAFQKVTDYRPPQWPSTEHPQQFHLDVTVNDPDAAEKEVLALGATKHEVQPGVPDDTFRVYLDPAGHPFCLCWD